MGNGLTTWYGYHGYEGSGNHDAYDALDGSWSGNGEWAYGRLWRICTTPHANGRCQTVNRDLPVSGQRLDLRHGYDRVGNVTSIKDYVNSSQVQTFSRLALGNGLTAPVG